MRKKKIAILGEGLLGTELHKLTGWDMIGRSSGVDICNFPSLIPKLSYYGIFRKYDIVVNCIANTDTYSTNKQSHWDVNYKAVYNLVQLANKLNIKLVHISTDFVYANCTTPHPSENDVPVHAENWYSYTKLLADSVIELLSKNYLILRGSHKPTPFPYQVAYDNVTGNFDYVNVIAAQIYELIETNQTGIINVGTDPKSFFELARQTNPDVTPITKINDPIKNRLYSIKKLKSILHSSDNKFDGKQ